MITITKVTSPVLTYLSMMCVTKKSACSTSLTCVRCQYWCWWLLPVLWKVMANIELSFLRKAALLSCVSCVNMIKLHELHWVAQVGWNCELLSKIPIKIENVFFWSNWTWDDDDDDDDLATLRSRTMSLILSSCANWFIHSWSVGITTWLTSTS